MQVGKVNYSRIADAILEFLKKSKSGDRRERNIKGKFPFDKLSIISLNIIIKSIRIRFLEIT